jgi:putative membrane protein
MAEEDERCPAPDDRAPQGPGRPDGTVPQSPDTAPAGDGALAGRLHPSAIALWSLRGLLPLVAAVWATDMVGQTLGATVLALLLGTSWVRWLRFGWRIDDSGLVIEQGLLQRRRRVIPLERIQAVQAQRSRRHRGFGGVGLRVEAIGGRESEGQLDALAPGVARQVQQALVGRSDLGPDAGAERNPSRQADPSPAPLVVGESPPPGTVLARSEPRQLLVAGLTGGRVGVAAAGLGIAQQVFGQGLADWAIGLPQRVGLLVFGGLVAAAAIAVFVVSVVATALAYWDFTVRRDGDLLRVQRGLLTERRDTVPLGRIQSVTVEQNIVRRAFGLASVSTVVAGRAGDDDGVTATLLPIGGLREALGLAGTVLSTAGYLITR